MAVKFQYNKTSLGEVERQLKMRQRALPTIKSKESALRVEVQRAKDEASGRERELASVLDRHDYMVALWGEFDASLVSVERLDEGEQKIAGVEIPVLKDIIFKTTEWDYALKPMWFADGVLLLQEMITLRQEHNFLARKVALLEHARKKTTQKVNLYEKVQIPDYQEVVRKIKRFMEDEENLSKSAQKIVKARRREAPEA